MRRIGFGRVKGILLWVEKRGGNDNEEDTATRENARKLTNPRYLFIARDCKKEAEKLLREYQPQKEFQRPSANYKSL